MDFCSGEALIAFDADLRVLAWNEAAERLTGIPADEAVGRYCWQVLGAEDENGAVVCHAGCSNARLMREGWPVASRRLSIRACPARKRVILSTLAVENGDEPVYVHLFRDDPESSEPRLRSRDGAATPLALTARQREILGLIAGGLPAKVIAARLGLTEITVRNHIRGILVRLGCHSQLEAVARARRLSLLEP